MAYDFQQGILEKLEKGTLENLDPEAAFTFSCSEACMGRCCNNITILLDPWDIEVMARHLELAGQEFFGRYCQMELEKGMGWPMVWLAHAQSGNCAFMLPDGKCSIYPARSRNCRTYPLGRAVRYVREGGEKSMEQRIFMVDRMDFCLGHRSTRSWTVREWFEDAGAGVYYSMSDQYAQLVDYAVRELNAPAWMNSGVVKMMMPFLYAPELLRSKIGLGVEQLTHEEFHRRRLQALQLVLTDLATGFGYGPAPGVEEAALGGSLMDRVQSVLTGNV